MAFHLVHIKNEAYKSLNRFGLTFSLKSNPMDSAYSDDGPLPHVHPNTNSKSKKTAGARALTPNGSGQKWRSVTESKWNGTVFSQGGVGGGR